MLEGWQGGTLPARVRPVLPLALAEANSLTRPASPPEFAQAIKLVTDWCEVHGLKVDGSKLAPVWKELLKDVPRDLLLSGVRSVLSAQVIHVVPKPGQVKDAIDVELVRRRSQRFLLDRASFQAKIEPKDEPRGEVTPEGREKAKAMFATLRRSLQTIPQDQMDADQLEAAKLSPDERVKFWTKRLA